MFHLASVNSMFEIRFTRRHGYYNYTGVFAAAVSARRASRIGCWNVGRIGGIKQCNSMVVLGDLPSMVRGPIHTYTDIDRLNLIKHDIGFQYRSCALYRHSMCLLCYQYQFVITSFNPTFPTLYNSHRCLIGAHIDHVLCTSVQWSDVSSEISRERIALLDATFCLWQDIWGTFNTF